ncbi:uncharacterized protein LOC143227238 isoform X2 [Tachypleus tridentatus]
MLRNGSLVLGVCLELVCVLYSSAHPLYRQVALQDLSPADPYWHSIIDGKNHLIGYENRRLGTATANLAKKETSHSTRNPVSLENFYHPVAKGDIRKFLNTLVNQRPMKTLDENIPLDKDALYNSYMDIDSDVRERRTFPEIDSRGFDEDVFDEGFGDWSPMKRGK